MRVATTSFDGGVWADYSGAKLQIARAGNPTFLRVLDRIEAPYRKKIQQGKMSTEQSIDNLCKAMGEAILIGWEGIETEDGPLEYSKENAFTVLRHNPEVREFVSEFAAEADNFRGEEITETAKKSQD